MYIQEYPWLITIYKGENRFLVVPNVKHKGNYRLESSWGINLNCDEQSELARGIEASLEYIKQSPISTVTPKEYNPAWKHNTKYKSWASFWKNNIRGGIIYYEDGQFKVCSNMRAATPRQEYGDCIKIIDLPAGTTLDEVAEAVLDVFEAAEEYYKTHKAIDRYPQKEITLVDDTKLTLKPPCDRHFEDSEDYGTGEIY